ncbi:unnamed protein product, partial [Brassica oleracea]
LATALVRLRKVLNGPTTGLTSNLLSWLAWALWISMNTLIFEKRQTPAIETATKAIKLAK